MRCPFCREDDDKVLETRPTESGFSVRRRRTCHACGRRFSTVEAVEQLHLRVIKKHGTSEPFEPGKIRRGVNQACSKRSIESSAIERLVRNVEAEIYATFDNEVAADQIGEFVCRHLAELDDVAYVRFASVYRDFETAADFLKILREMPGGRAAGKARRTTPRRAKTRPPAAKTSPESANGPAPPKASTPGAGG